MSLSNAFSVRYIYISIYISMYLKWEFGWIFQNGSKGDRPKKKGAVDGKERGSDE